MWKFFFKGGQKLEIHLFPIVYIYGFSLPSLLMISSLNAWHLNVVLWHQLKSLSNYCSLWFCIIFYKSEVKVEFFKTGFLMGIYMRQPLTNFDSSVRTSHLKISLKENVQIMFENILKMTLENFMHFVKFWSF